ncbi:MAG TPA: transglycosylase SLT domain-containing protein [Burkholderiales bacterium]|nr:transglycosylase SLT domain-containing protein [Burkholderiales bacterium]
MAFPISDKILTPVVIAAAALLIAAAPPAALAPDLPAAACAPDNEANLEAEAPAAPDPAQQVLTAHLSKRFFIAPGATERMVAAAHRAAAEVGLDPLLVLAVIAIESRFNPIAESVMGAKGLMQIIPKYHLDKLRAAGGEDMVFDPESNIHVGTRILQEYVYRTGTLEAGLQFYNGAWRDNSAAYAHKVMAERDRLEQVLRQRVALTVAVNQKGL